ncbi:hypothetical protein N7539_009501 [Penicillium diatomitis]|uniref:Uncharacterized protein n=1 Tax=Penicillium diatomitis TaxID=2819901 RepID=A0A9W9WKB6_9EURO|nr:uncharacterized protein N7539_009501 [Penicillium diatomitis]KAJ5466545.1 hypothetical protein N7539_009501 [Penicillium diatomitis]
MGSVVARPPEEAQASSAPHPMNVCRRKRSTVGASRKLETMSHFRFSAAGKGSFTPIWQTGDQADPSVCPESPPPPKGEGLLPSTIDRNQRTMTMHNDNSPVAMLRSGSARSWITVHQEISPSRFCSGRPVHLYPKLCGILGTPTGWTLSDAMADGAAAQP